MIVQILTLRIWEALRFPEESNPLFARVRSQAIQMPGARFLRPLVPLYSTISVLASALLVIVAPVALLIVSNFLGALVAFNVLSTINREREQETYDLLAMTPMGRGKANWQIAVATVYRLNVLDRLASLRIFTITAVILLILALLEGTVITAFSLLALLLALHIDVIQSQIVGCLSGIVAQRFGSPFAALAIFAFIQIIAVYLPVTTAAIFLYDSFRVLGWSRWIVEGAVGIMAVILLFGLRETIIRLMLRDLERRLL